ncbi:MAG TPA: hypothetical protein DD727_04130 [Clostridiales bacterium]|nr:hypothetical protein [Clostridiales bacterium]
MRGCLNRLIQTRMPVRIPAYFVFIGLLLAGLIVFNLKNMTVMKDGVVISFKTLCTLTGDALRSKGIVPSDQDYVSSRPDERLKKNNTIYIKTAVPIQIEYDGRTAVFHTWRDRVREALQDSGIGYTDSDRLEGALAADPVVRGMQVKVIRVQKNILTDTEPIHKSIRFVNNYLLGKGIENMLAPGEDGLNEKTWAVLLEDGKEKSRVLISEKVLKEPREMVIERGAANTGFTNRGESFRYSEVYDMNATCYTLAYEECGKYPGDPGYGITASGIPARRGIVAVNPAAIPYGTRLYIETADGSGYPDYGYAVAGDTGHLGTSQIDLFVDEQREAFIWGIRPVRVYILLP